MARKNRIEVVESKTPAEFFSEHQSICGFDNPGRSLYTTVRELVENALDAAESIQVLPHVSVVIEEITEDALNELRGMESRERVDLGLFHKATGKRRSGGEIQEVLAENMEELHSDALEKQMGQNSAALSNKKKGDRGARNYYRVTCEDNGCGMAHEKIPDMLGRVLSSSKYGVRQTRGKFGLGSKMALIWSKKSTGLPIEVRSAHSLEENHPAAYISHCVLDIDIYRNQPFVKLHEKVANIKGWRGTRIDVVVEGNWSTYKTHIMTYFQQLAIITPYAHMEFTFRTLSNASREVITQYARRSEHMPPPAQEVKHHPSSINHLIIQQLIKRTSTKTFLNFLCTELACVTRPLAARIVKELGNGFAENMVPEDIDANKTIRLTSMLKSISIFKLPDGSCLSPAGEYNLRLGIMKELHPDYVATVSEQAAAFEGHPFVVEAGVSLGGNALKDGINVYRFANRIPLLFEAGNDVVTQVANRRINWQSYKIDPKRDRIGVFVSIVSTKIPFKGTGKEYIGDDTEAIRKSVKSALQRCCKQLKQHLLTRNAARDVKERKRSLLRYMPDVSRAIAAVLNSINKRKRIVNCENWTSSNTDGFSQPQSARHKQAKLFDFIERKWDTNPHTFMSSHLNLVEEARNMDLVDEKLQNRLKSAIDRVDLESALEVAAINGSNGGLISKERLFVAPLQLKTSLTTSLLSPLHSVHFYSSALVAICTPHNEESHKTTSSIEVPK